MVRTKHTNSRWVVKVGSALLTNNGLGLDVDLIKTWVSELTSLHENGLQIVLVSSGAVAEGAKRLGFRHRPTVVSELQAAAAVGQMGLVQTYESAFKHYNLQTAQILLTRDDLANRKRYLNARSTLMTLLDYQAIPVINENDTVATDEIRFGDNDTLAALVANLIEADKLIILTDQEGLFNKDPRLDNSANLIAMAKANDPGLLEMAGGSQTSLGRGGMITKINAARIAARSGASTVIASGRRATVLQGIFQGEKFGTLLIPDENPITARKRWLAGQLESKGVLVLDQGAEAVLINQGKSLLAVGVKTVSGDFSRGELVSCVNEAGHEVARGLVNYGKAEAEMIIGCPSEEFENRLGYQGDCELIHRDNLVLV